MFGVYSSVQIAFVPVYHLPVETDIVLGQM